MTERHASIEARGAIGFLNCKHHGEGGGANAIHAQSDIQFVLKAARGLEVCLEGYDRPSRRSVENGNFLSLEKVVHSFLHKHKQPRKMGYSGRIGIGKANRSRDDV